MAPRILEKALHSDIADDVIRCNILPRLPFKLTTQNGILSLLASTNGLVCILYTPTNFISHSRAPTLFIANPATQKAQSVPGTTKHITRFDKRIGLAFDPVDNFQENTVSKFKIVKAVVQPFMWKTKINCNNKKVAYGSGIMYWDYQEIVLWFDIATDIAGIVKMPWIQLGVEVKGPVHHDIDTSANGMLVCTTIDKGGLIVYHLVGPERLTERRLVRPIGVVDGRFVYIGVRQEWKTKDKILCYNIVTGKTYGTGKGLGNRYSKNPFYVYRNSMPNIPHIAVPAQGKICEGSTGGCICAMYTGEVKGPVHHDIDTSANGMLVCTTIDKGGLPMYHLVGVNTDFN
uniref:Uncharacterized protein n=1 Tax=Oryza glumipatula TaxID=40148 RepID=A0A0D9Y8Z1_9ORYZ